MDTNCQFSNISYLHNVNNEIVGVERFKYNDVEYDINGSLVDCFYKGAETIPTPSPNLKCFFNALCLCLRVESKDYIKVMNKLRNQYYAMSIWTASELKELLRELDPNDSYMATYYSIIHVSICLDICICIHDETWDSHCKTFGDRSKLMIHMKLESRHYEAIDDPTYDYFELSSVLGGYLGSLDDDIDLPSMIELKVETKPLGDVFTERGQWYNSLASLAESNLHQQVPQFNCNLFSSIVRLKKYSRQQEVAMLSLNLGMTIEVRLLSYHENLYSLEGGFKCVGPGNGLLELIYDGSTNKWFFLKISGLLEVDQNYQVLEKVHDLESLIRQLTQSFVQPSNWYSNKLKMIEKCKTIFPQRREVDYEPFLNKNKLLSLCFLSKELENLLTILLVDNDMVNVGTILKPKIYKYWGQNPELTKKQKHFLLDSEGNLWGAVKSGLPVTVLRDDQYDKDFPTLSFSRKTAEFLFTSYDDDIQKLTNPEHSGYDESMYGLYEMHPRLKVPETSEIVSPDETEIVISFENRFGNRNYHDFPSIPDNRAYSCKISTVKNIVHDFTFALFGDDLDVSFTDAGLFIPGDPDNNKTPDMIIKHGEKHYSVIEFTTRNTNMRPDVRSRGWEDKTLKYRDAIHNRRDHFKISIDYYIIVVCQNGVQTNLVNLPTETMDELIYRYKLARQIALQIEQNLEYDIKADQAMKMEISSIKKIIEGIRIHKEDGELDPSKFIKPYTMAHYTKAVGTLESEDYDYLHKLDTHVSNKSMRKMEKLKHLNDVNIRAYRDEIRNESILMMQSRKMEYESNFIKNEEAYRTSNKASVQLPMLVPKIVRVVGVSNTHEEVRNVVDEIISTSSMSSTEEAWKQGICGFMHYLYEIEDGKSDFSLAMEEPTLSTQMEDDLKKIRNKFNRISMVFDMDDRIDLAKIGINGKKYSKDPEVLAYRNESKKPFSLFTSTDDIERFINEECLQLFTPHDQELDNSVLDLISDSLKIHGCSSQSRLLESLDTYLKSKAYLFTKFVSDLAVELSISVKQNCQPREFIVKRLRDFQVYVLIKSTGSDGKVFFSLLFREDQELSKIINTTFKKVSRLGDRFLYTDFISVNYSKLVNWTRCESLMLSLYAFWREQYNIPPNIGISSVPDEDFNSDYLKMWANCLLVLLNDKHQTEEVITSTRFIHMEAFVETPNWPKPHKMFEKLSAIPRSRLEVFYIKSAIKLMECYTETPIRLDNSGPMRRWYNIKNPFVTENGSLSNFPNHDVMLSSMYLGYLKNKDEDPEDNASGQLISKILGYEDKLPRGEDKKYLGLEDPPVDQCSTHMYSISLVKRMCDSFLGRLKSETGVSDPKDYLSTLCLEYLSHEFLESFVTLKASSNFSAEYYEYRPNENKRSRPQTVNEDLPKSESNRRNYGRSKVIEKIQTILTKKDPNEKYRLVVDLLKESLEEVEKNACLHVCIFRKNQHGGLREIYVLNIYERIVQKCVEDLARAILSVVPSETMTHPKNKFQIPNKHNIAARKEFGDSYFTVCTSDDASKWNQGHHVSKFITILVRILPKFWHGFIVRALQLWFHKRLFLGDDLLRLFCANDVLNTTDEKVKKVHEVFKGREVAPWMTRGMTYIETESGFMQGILHYISSLFHAIFLEDLAERQKKQLPQMARIIQPDNESNVIIDCMESSDDSSMMISFSTKSMNDRQTFAMLLLVDRAFSLKEYYGDMLGIYKSIKSTTGTIFMMEFNSEFFFAGDTHRPTIRWVNAALNVSEQETLIASQEEMSNTLKDILEGGGTFYHTFVTQVAQAMLHYRMYGSSVSPLWGSYCSMIKLSKDPALGYFLMDHPMASGLMGFGYNLWKTCKQSFLSVKYADMLNMEFSTENSKRKMTPDIANLGVLSRTTTVGFGNKTKWMKMCDRMHLTDDIFDSIEQNPRILFFHAKNAEEMQQKIAIKMRSPGVMQSLAKTNTLGRRVASSVYFISRNVLFSMSAGVETDEKRKTSIFRELLNSNSNVVSKIGQKEAQIPGVQSLTEEPSDDFYSVEGLREGVIKMVSVLTDLTMEQSERLLSEKFGLTLDDTKLNDWFIDENKLMHKLSKGFGINIHVYISRDPEASFKLCHTFKCLTNSENLYFMLNPNYLLVRRQESSSMSDEHRRQIQESYKEIQSLFPEETDYLEIESNLSSLNLNMARSGINQRRRVRSQIQLTGTEQSSTFSVYSVAKFIWFGEKDVPAHPKTLKIVWKKYKETWLWLRDTIGDTLVGSPFVSYIQLNNYLSRVSTKGRVLHFVGTMGKASSGNVNLMTLIRNNFSNGIVFSGGFTDVIKKEKTEDYKSLLSNLTMLNQSPLKYEEKLVAMTDLIVDNKDLEYSTSMLGSKRNKLAIIQMFLRTDPDLKFSGDYNTQDAVNLVEHHLGEFDQNLSLGGFRSLIRMGQLVEKELLDSGMGYEELEKNFEDLTINSLSASARRAYCQYIYCDRVLEDAYQQYNKRKPTQKMLLSLELLKAEAANDPTRNWLTMIGHRIVKSSYDLMKLRDEAKYCRRDIMEKIRIGNLGLLGGYVQKQSYNREEKKYFGPGVWRGYLHDVAVQIEVNSDQNMESYIKSVSLSSAMHLSDTIQSLKEWSREHRVGNSHYTMAYGNRDCEMLGRMFEFRRIQMSDRDGCPIVLDPKLIIHQPFLSDSFCIDITDHSIRLLQECTGERAPYTTVLTVHLSKKDVITSELQSQQNVNMIKRLKMDDWLKDWILWRDQRAPTSLFTQMNLGQFPDLVDEKRLKSWCRELFESSLGYQKIVQLSKLSKAARDRLAHDYPESIQEDKEVCEELESMESLLTRISQAYKTIDMTIKDEDLEHLYELARDLAEEQDEIQMEKEAVNVSLFHRMFLSSVRKMDTFMGTDDLRLTMNIIKGESRQKLPASSMHYKRILQFMYDVPDSQFPTYNPPSSRGRGRRGRGRSYMF
uniref:RNA-directed RNA polymerase L n=5 Tax=Tenuivirus oryzabrevis TaxID=3052762 RepID=A0A2R3YZQ2_9VIRU|nr:RNA polymerase [Tenuivirus oryzabrevis]